MSQPSTTSFKRHLAQYKTLLDADLADYTTTIQARTQKDYGERSLVAVDPYCALLQAGGKRIRGRLVMIGYEMMCGTDQKMIIQAARALEMIHAYILIVDDVQDRSHTRRGSPTAHRIITQQHQSNGWKNDPDHLGISLALNGALLGLHAAEMVLANLEVPDELRVKAINITNHTMMITIHGQTNDLLNEIADDVSSDTLKNVMQWKTAHYTLLNPLHVGMVLADAGCEDTNAITQYALHTGYAFQITDDLLLFSTAKDNSGKDPIDDIREGKQTILTVHAAVSASPKDATFVALCLGKKDLTNDEFERFKQVLIDCGAVGQARQQASEHVAIARQSLVEHKDRWKPESVAFLDELAQYILDRKK
ncbi:MAG: polyprenyl synthetase family protein [Candidatus Saccharimonadales bacterium]